MVNLGIVLSWRHITKQLICIFVFANTRSGFSHDAAHMPGYKIACHKGFLVENSFAAGFYE